MNLETVLQRRNDKKAQKRAKSVEESLRRFDNLKSLDTETKSILRKRLEKYIPELIKADTQLKYGIDLTFLLFCLIFVIELLLFGFILKKPEIEATIALNALLKSISVVPLQIIADLFFGLMFLATSLYVIFAIPFMISQQYARSLENRIIKEHVLDYITDELIAILIVVEDNPDDRNTIYFQYELLKKIERTSQLFEHFLPLKFLSLDFQESARIYAQEMDQMRSGKMSLSVRINDNATDAWLKERMKQVAAALREKKKWILTPKEDTYDYFVKSISSTLICFARGNWDTLERKEVEGLTSAQGRKTFVQSLFNTLKTALKAGLPLGAFFVFQQITHTLTGALYNTLATLLIIYAVTVFASALDPNFSTKISNIKDIRSLWN